MGTAAFLLVFCLLGRSGAGIFGSWQKVIVAGKLKCNDKPAEHVKVLLIKTNDLAEETLATVFTNGLGVFRIEAEAKERDALSSTVHLIHRCGDAEERADRPLCPIDVSIDVPAEFVNDSADTDVAERTLELVVELGKSNSSTSRNCDQI